MDIYHKSRVNIEKIDKIEKIGARTCGEQCNQKMRGIVKNFKAQGRKATHHSYIDLTSHNNSFTTFNISIKDE